MRFILQVCLGIIRNQTHRRNLAAGIVVVALVMLFFGSTFISPWLMSRPFVFLGFWLTCLWLTLLAFLLGAYDLLSVRRAGREEHRRLRKEIFSSEDEHS